MAEGDPQNPATDVAAGFGNDPKGAPVQSCPTWIELRFEPKPRSPLPSAPGPGSGEESFVDRYVYKLTAGGAVLKTGVLDLRNGSVIRADNVPCGPCSIAIDFPRFTEGNQGAVVTWRKQWQTMFTVKQRVFHDLETGKVHYFDIINEVPAVAEFMANEMNTNANSSTVKDIRAMNDSAGAMEQMLRDNMSPDRPFWEKFLNNMGAASMQQGAASSRVAAMGAWYLKVRTGGPWDHKPIFRSRQIGETVPGSWHTWGEWEYYCDPWSNFHYGYVGRAAGFSREALLSGSDIQQMFDDSKVDPPQDRASMQIGIDLYDQGTPITPELLIQKLESNPLFDRRPHSHTSANDTPTVKKREP